MHLLGKYQPSDRLHELIADHYRLLLPISRFGLSLGMGDKTIAEVCAEHHVDVDTFLAVINLLCDGYSTGATHFSVEALLNYLHQSHNYFLDYRLPSIRHKLQEALSSGQGELNAAILRYFDEYIAEVQKHMYYEEHTVFPYVRALLKGEKKQHYTIDVFSRQHDRIEVRLGEFKTIIIKYYPAKSTNELHNVLFDIFNCEHDLASHNAVEDHLFIPSIKAMEQKMK